MTIHPVTPVTPPSPADASHQAPSAGHPIYQMTSLGRQWAYTLPTGLFSTPVTGDTLTYAATLADGSALPAWLRFDQAKQAFSGTPDGKTPNSMEIKITATNKGGLSSSTTLTLQTEPNVFEVGTFQTVSAPAGQASIFESGTFAKLTAGNEDHALLVTGAFDSATLGNGNNSVILAGSSNTLTAGNGNNAVTATDSSATVKLGDGNNTIVTEGSANVTVGAGRNSIKATGSFTTLNLGDGNNTIVAVGGSANVTVGAGSNTIKATGSFTTLNLGDGTDAATLGNSFANVKVGHGTYDLEFASGFGSKLAFGADATSDRLWFQHVGSDLRIGVLGSAENVTVKNWYASNPEHVSQIVAGDGKALSDFDVEKLVQAMAAFAPPAAGQAALTANEQKALQPALAANWR
ncbi:putative Ig domain-containing protein [Trinickia fusca]|uniref:putative Ig domain-containing protein n=1 Tax=Trinickia fusca TaxID=2419777 RepID=UPI001C7E1A75|nr:putative Ig domain-containing protein [Trinickia fusca]